MIKILLDPQIFTLQEFGGISRYYTEVYTFFDKEEQTQIICPLQYTDNIHFKESPLFKNSFQNKARFLIKYSKIFRSYAPRKLKRKNQEKAIDLLDKKEYDVFVPTYYDPYFLKFIGTKPYVLTVYDMIHEIYPSYFANDKSTVPNKKTLIENATKIIAISESTKNDIIKIYPNIPEDKIEVVYLAHTIKTETSIRLDLPEKYILFVGNRSIYKNFFFFLNAIADLILETPDLYIVCAGGNSFTKEEIELINKLDITDRIVQRNFKDAELACYYKQALCFVFPSEYEGFGIPVLESMACGCPVVLANHSSFPEVAADAGIYFELNDSNDLKGKIYSLINDSELRKQYSLKGIDQAKKFTWKKTAEESLKVYQSVI
ncbi:MAG: glycosyltransferase family 4 protein [Pedobacter sp.]|nr:glycosyltransferase family 4 protein [Pedobacter sp.]